MSFLGSQELIRDINSHLVLQTIINEGPLSRADLSKNLGLTKATISSIVQNLMNNSLVVEIGSLNTDKGRKPILLDFNNQCGFILSIDLSVDTMTALLTDLRGTNRALKQYAYPSDSGSEIVPNLIKIIKGSIDSLPLSVYGVVGICIGVHGVVHDNKAIFTPYYQLANLNLADELEQFFNIPVYLENEANLSALGEKNFYYDSSNLINISVHSGVGLGIIMDNHLYTGQHGYAGEFGHTIIVPDGKPCPCGNHGCIEQYASQRAIVHLYRYISGNHGATADDLMKAYSADDIYARQSIEAFIKYMSIGINNILTTFNPDIIVINSLFTMNIPDIIPRLEHNIHNYMNKYCTIVPSILQDMAILLGGVYICCKNFLKIDYLQLKREVLNI